jgi:hypothetical protein
VRWMAQYNPRSIQLDDPGESNQDKVTNVFKMSARVYRYEVRSSSLSFFLTEQIANLHIGISGTLQRN